MKLGNVNKGFTLIETIVTIVVLSIAAAGLLGVFITGVARSADPMLNMQALAIAQGYLEESLLKAYADPDGGETNSCEEGSANTDRANYDDVWDYHDTCINDNDGARDQFGNQITGLEAYNVQMLVSNDNINGVTALRVDVNVTHANPAVNITLTGFRTNY